jgi:hypothetical protein
LSFATDAVDPTGTGRIPAARLVRAGGSEHEVDVPLEVIVNSSFIARPVGLFGIGLAAIFFGCNSAPPLHRDSLPTVVQAPGGVAGTGDVSDPSAGAAGTNGTSDPSNGGQEAAGAVAISATDPSGSGGATAISTTDPSGGADGGAPVCESGEMRCTEGCTSTCQADGTWGPAVACPGHQTCSISTGLSKCVCKVDTVFCGKTAGPTCYSDTSIVNCATDEFGCIFTPKPTECPHGGACTGEAGKAVCAGDPCTTVGETRCEGSFAMGTCTATASGGSSFVTSACAAGTVCGRNAPASCKDPNWADWPMPNGLLDASNGAPNPQRFTDNGDGSVTDNVTGLEWWTFSFYSQTFAEAVDLCLAARILQTEDWRVPSLVELISIADFGQPSNIDQRFFPPPNDLNFWTSTLRGDGSDSHFSFNFALGQVVLIDDQSQDALHPNSITCVR